jgi:hypothetical protein
MKFVKNITLIPPLFFIIFLSILFIFDTFLPKKVNNLNTYISDYKKTIENIKFYNKNIKLPDNFNFKESDNKVNNPLPSMDSIIWEEEIRVLDRNKSFLHGNGPLQYNPVIKSYVKDPFDILIIGDSYSIGQFGDFNAYSYPAILENKLNENFPGSFRVRVLGTEKASFLRQSDWITLDRLKSLKPDMIILTYTMGRYIPTYYENKYCKEYNICIKDGQTPLYDDAYNLSFFDSNEKYKIMVCLSKDNIINSIFKKLIYPFYPNLGEHLASLYCNDKRINNARESLLPTERNANYYTDPSKTKYYKDFLEYLYNIKKVTDQYDLLRKNDNKDKLIKNFINITMYPEHQYPEIIYKGKKWDSLAKPLLLEYKKYGFEEIPNYNARNMIKDLKTWELGKVTGIGENNFCDYDCFITELQMKKNINNFLSGVINHPLRVRHGIKLSNTLAEDIYNSIDFNNIVKSEIKIKQSFLLDYLPYNLSYKDLGNNNYIIGYNNDINKANNNILCARVNSPYASFILNNNNFKNYNKLSIAYYYGDISNMLINIEYFNSDNSRTIKDSYIIKKNEKITLPFNKNISAIYISEYGNNCLRDMKKLKNFNILININ